MKKILLALPFLALFISFAACTQQQKWNQEQRQALRESLKDYRQMVYLEDLTDPEFGLFSEGVEMDLETAYPAYTSFIATPNIQDTIQMVVVNTIVEELNADAHNMRHLYPYNYLVAQGVLPSDLTREQVRAFYSCFAGKVNGAYNTMGQFFYAVLADTTNTSQINQMQQQCANDLFNWTFTEVDVIETMN
ncbi:MAG: hypothetical protein RR279_01995 [Alistipes sp.]